MEPKPSKEVEDFLEYAKKRIDTLIALNRALDHGDDIEMERARNIMIAGMQYAQFKYAELYDDYKTGKQPEPYAMYAEDFKK